MTTTNVRAARTTATAALHRLTLPNGLRVLLAPVPGTPGVAVAVHVDVGFRSEPEGRTGFAHLFEHLMFQGSESLPKQEHSQYMQGSGAIVNGSTHPDYTDYFEVLPAEALERALFLEGDRLRAPTLTEESLRRQVDVVKEEIRLNVFSKPYGGFPWIPLPPLLYDTFANAHNGYSEFTPLETATLDDAAAFFDTHYAPGNAVLTVTGDLDVDATVALVERYFGDIPARPLPTRSSIAEPLPHTERRHTVLDPHAPLPALALGYRLPDPTTDLDGYLAQALLGSVLADGENARLQRRLADGADGAGSGARVTALSAGCGLFGIPLNARDPDTFTVTALHPRTVDPDRVVAVVDDELERLAETGPDTAELARIAARWSASLHQRQDRLTSRLLALGSRELLYGRAELTRELPARVAAVTSAQVAAAAARLRDQGRALLLVETTDTTATGPATAGAASVAAAAAATSGTATGTAADRDGRPERPGAAAQAGAGHRSAEQIARTAGGPRPVPPMAPRRPGPDLAPVERMLDTGLRVIAVARPTVPMVELRLRIPFADPAPGPESTHRAGAELLSATMLAGTAHRDRAALDRELAGAGADIGLSVDPERLWLSASGLADELPALLGLVADVLVGAEYPEPAVVRERRRLIERMTVARAAPRAIAREALQRSRYGDHAAARETPRPDDLAAVTADQVRALHRTGVLPAGSTLVLVGDLDPERDLDRVADALAGWAAPDRAVELGAPGTARRGLVLVDRPGAVQSQLRLAAPAVGRADPRYPAVQLANLCLTGYGSARLNGNLREDKGYTYHAVSRLEHTPHGAWLLLETDVTREVTAAALREVRYELDRLATAPPADDEIDAARRFALGTLQLSLDSQPGLAAILATLTEEGLDAAWLRRQPERLAAVSADDVAEAAVAFFTPTAFTEVVVGDAARIAPELRALP